MAAKLILLPIRGEDVNRPRWPAPGLRESPHRVLSQRFDRPPYRGAESEKDTRRRDT
jgi:hypothetical protein